MPSTLLPLNSGTSGTSIPWSLHSSSYKELVNVRPGYIPLFSGGSLRPSTTILLLISFFLYLFFTISFLLLLLFLYYYLFIILFIYYTNYLLY
jgi:hypothetical protein